MPFRSPLVALVFAGLATAQVTIPAPSIGPRAYPFQIPVRLNDQVSTTVWFIAGDAEPKGLDGIYNPVLDILIRRDTSIMRRFAQSAYGISSKPAPRPAGALPPSGPIDAKPSPIEISEQRLTTLLRRPFTSSLGTFHDLGTIDLSERIPLGAAQRFAAIAALTGAQWRTPRDETLSESRSALHARTMPPVEAWCVDAFPKMSTPEVVVRHHRRQGTSQTTIAILGSSTDREIRIPLHDLGLDNFPHVCVDLLRGTSFTTDNSELVCDVPGNGVRLLAAAIIAPAPTLLHIGDHLAGGLDLVQSITFEGSGEACRVTCTLADVKERPRRLTAHVPTLGVVSIPLESVEGEPTTLTSGQHRWTPIAPEAASTRPTPTSRPIAWAGDLRSWPGFRASPWADGFRRDQSAWGTGLKLNGSAVVHGLGTITGTKATIPFDNKAKALSFLAGPASEGQARINVLCDGVLKASIDIGGAAPSAYVTIDLRGTAVATIEVVTPSPVTRPVDVTLANISLELN